MGEKTIATNRRARHEYQILERLEAGLELRGTEVKSLRNGKVSFKDSYIEPTPRGELVWVGAHINPYEQGNIWNHDPERPRKLLLHKQQILRLSSQVAEKGLTLVPLRLYFKNGIAKVEVGLCRGKQTTDKRATIRERDAKREVERAVKSARLQKR